MGLKTLDLNMSLTFIISQFRKYGVTVKFNKNRNGASSFPVTGLVSLSRGGACWI